MLQAEVKRPPFMLCVAQSATSRAPLLQLELVELVQQALASLPASLQALGAQAAAQAAALQQQHGFSLHGLGRLLGQQAGGAAASPTAVPGRSMLAGSLLLAGGLPGRCTRGERQQYATAVLSRFQAKLCGSSSGSGSQGAGEVAAAQPDVGTAVGRLIAAATSAAHLARMYEGWMPWV